VNPIAIRRLLVAVCAGGIAGMIATSIADSNDGALVFGLLTAAAALGMILVTAVTSGGRARSDDELAEALEDRIDALVSAGADERIVRALVRDAVRLGRQSNALP
jgi:DNA-binding LacI/PurR family transcriptional regulator